jgi:hydrogenase/urease accessory protein HupE
MQTRADFMALWRTVLGRLACALLACLAVGLQAGAHEMSLAELDMREVSQGHFIWHWGASSTARPVSADLKPVWPEGCTEGEQSLHCDAPGLVGTLGVEGVGKTYSAALVRIHWRDGQSSVVTLTAAQPTAFVHGAAEDRRPWSEIARAYVVLGIEHILSGVDHLLFVFALLFLVGYNRRLVATITAFTVAHSLTLASSALGWLTLRAAPVEATIALSIVLVAGEALHTRPTLARRWPAVLAFVFGLAHGLGFAGALRDVGLPDNHLVVALFSFNVGVECGQLLAIGAALLLVRLFAAAARRWRAAKPRNPTQVFATGRMAPPVLARTAALYLIGIVGAFWSWQRLAAMLA